MGILVIAGVFALAVVGTAGALGLVKGLQIGTMIAAGKAFVPPP